MSMKSLMPRSLFGRAALILVLPIVTIQLVVSMAFIQRHFEGVTRQMTGSIRVELDYLQRLVDRAESLPEAQAAIAELADGLRFTAGLPAASPEPMDDKRRFWDLSGRVVVETLREDLEGLRRADLESSTREARLWIDTKFGTMEVVVDRRRASASNPHQLLVVMAATSILMTLIASLFLRNQLRPITRLAEAADAFGKGRHVPYRPGGAIEVRAAGHAFLDMRARIERQIEQRTLMLSGVSHDLRTPLTRLRLGLSMLPEDAETRALIADVVQMEGMVDAFLAFARGDAVDDLMETDAAQLVREVVDAAQRGGQPVSLGQIEGAAVLPLRAQAMRRALSNLVDNAVRFGSRVVVSFHGTDRSLRFVVEDDGPGIPKERRDEAMRPFTRLDSARNLNEGGGVGLGLSITADIARSHGGTLRLGQSETLGGLKAEIVLGR